jgi:hypothetical protein
VHCRVVIMIFVAVRVRLRLGGGRLRWRRVRPRSERPGVGGHDWSARGLSASLNKCALFGGGRWNECARSFECECSKKRGWSLGQVLLRLAPKSRCESPCSDGAAGSQLELQL